MRRILLVITTFLSIPMVIALSSGAALATTPGPSDCPGGSRGQILSGIGESGAGGCNSSGVSSIVTDVVQLLSYFAGVLAIIMVIVAGVKYITSSGDSNKVGNAKSTLLYALIGIAIAALAQVLVHFVLNRASVAANSPCPTDSSITSSDPGCKK